MDNDRISLELRSWNLFRSPGLVVNADLLGATHTFDFAGRSCTVTLPPPSEALKNDSDRVRLYCYTEDGGRKKAISYEIHSVNFSVNVPSRVSLPKSVLARSPNAYDLLQKQEQTALGVLAKNCHDLSLQSYDLWLRTMRWRTQQPLFGRESVESVETGWSTYLLDCDSGHRVWADSQTIVIGVSSEITRTVWDTTQQCLSCSSIPSIAVDLYADAVFHMINGDLERAVADAAVAAESYIRSKIQESLPTDAGVELRKFLDEANIRPVMTKLFPEAIASMGAGTMKKPSVMHELFDARNKILHLGILPGLSREKCSKYVEAVRSLIAPLFSDPADSAD